MHRSTDLRPADHARREGVPLTNPLRTVADLGAVAPELVAGAIEQGLVLAGWHLVRCTATHLVRRRRAIADDLLALVEDRRAVA